METRFKKVRKLIILFVAFGSPKQEIWISENLKNLPVKIAIGVGGSFDFYKRKKYQELLSLFKKHRA
jgi:N-acetylglucosaminyldiphosphoundecaprenol N-acetyl-beta-D-mannosaminyltransferase